MKRIWILLLVVIFMSAPVAAAAQKASKILILPFAIHSDQSLEFLARGIYDMLGSRLADTDRVSILPRQTAAKADAGVTMEQAVSMGKSLGADYVVFGSLTLFGGSISTDARFADVAAGTAPVVFHESGADTGDVIDHVDRFAAMVNQKVFGRAPAQKTAAAAAQPQQDPALASRRHPDTLMEQGVDGSDGKNGFVRSSRRMVQGDFAGWRSSNMPYEFRSISVADVDGDGANEMVVGSDRSLFVYRFSGGRLEKLAVYEGDINQEFITLDAADINANGKAEIFVTNLRANNAQLDSFVLEWDQGRLVRIIQDQNWYFRVLAGPHGDRTLLGQRRTGTKLFAPSVFYLEPGSGGYLPGKRLNLPDSVNIYGFTMGNALNNGKEVVAALTDAGHLRILSKEGEEIWASQETYGGSEVYIQPNIENVPKENRRGDNAPMDRVYMKQRIFIRDMDGNGKNEVVLVKNRDVAKRLLGRVRSLQNGSVAGLEWDNVGFYEKFETRTVSRYIGDMDVADMDNDGAVEIVYFVVGRSLPLVGSAKSFLVAEKIK